MTGGGSLLLPRAYPIKDRDARPDPRSQPDSKATRRGRGLGEVYMARHADAGAVARLQLLDLLTPTRADLRILSTDMPLSPGTRLDPS